MPLISPNLHVILVHYPLAFLVFGTLIEAFWFLWPRSGFRSAGRWMILLGALAGIPAVYSGIYAMRDVARAADAPWYELKAGHGDVASPVFTNPETWKLLRSHLLIQLAATAVNVTVVVLWLGCGDRGRHFLRIPLLLVLLASVTATGIGAWFGGEMIYKAGVSVEAKFPRRETDPPPNKIEGMFPVIELHVVAAGLVTALAAASIGLSFRKVNSIYELADNRPIKPTGQTMADAQRGPPSEVAMARTINPGVAVEMRPFAPAGRFWILTFLLAACTAAGGIFYLARDISVLPEARTNPKQFARDLCNQIKPDKEAKTIGQKVNRRLAHTATGTAIIVLPLVLAGLSRFAPRRKFVLSVAAFFLVCAIALQAWLGVLLLFDTTSGTITKLNPATASKLAE